MFLIKMMNLIVCDEQEIDVYDVLQFTTIHLFVSDVCLCISLLTIVWELAIKSFFSS